MKYISPGSWFSLEYPAGWHEFEDTEDSFLFYNPEKWNGNFRISAFKGQDKKYAEECMDYELKNNRTSRLVKVGEWSCVYSTENFQENGNWYTSHLWITGKGDISVECSFTVAKGESMKPAESIITSLKVRCEGEKPWKGVIPVRVLEINAINESFDWAVMTIKKQLTKDFTSSEADIASIQKVMDSGKFNNSQRQAWESFGMAFGAILVNEMDGMEWVTVIDGQKEYPALKFAETDVMVYPQQLIWSRVKNGKSCSLKAEFEKIKEEVEKAINN
ncbi:DUF3805 domain-containing protein [Bacteroides caecigallinarum]|uniref:DUF3805 domain-containing protein n=1 Tax=Bacteroides caecigallinarum TaxID=1411144 RepID=UPI00195B8AC7|nr:DUF3805 domain-containing protein [Bacteroides caecigallinarum]MBM6960214.1 DUF3805 domain-containing protein [Bacteroides caecigallinarum]